MPTIQQIAAAFRAGITSNPTQASLLRDLRRNFREPEDNIEDLVEATRYLSNTAAAAITQPLFGQALSFIVPNLGTMPPGPGAGSVRNVRQSMRALLTDATSPQWLKDLCEATKRTKLLDTAVDLNGPGGFRMVYDQQATDPIVAAADAAVQVLQAANSTPEALVAATGVVNRYKELTPKQPDPYPDPVEPELSA